MKLGVLGTGMIAKEFLSLLEKLDIEETYLLSTPRSRDRALSLCVQYGLKGCFTDCEKLLPLVDAVYIALPNDLHFPYAKKALLAGKHVIVEKPAAADLAQLRQLWALAEERGLFLLEAMTTYHQPAYLALREALPRIGRLRLAALNFSQYSSRYDAFLAGDIKPAFDPAHAGGALMDLNVYNIHALLGLFGTPADIQYCANLRRGVDTSGVLTLKYPDFTAVCLAAKDCSGPNGILLEGEQGILHGDEPLSLLSRFTLRLRDGTEETFSVPAPEHRMLYEFQHFLPWIARGDLSPCRTLMERSLAAAEILEKARKQAGVLFPSDL